MLLDFKPPERTGEEVLRSIKESHELAQVPLVVLTSSDSRQDRLAAAELNVSRYLRRSSNLEEFVQVGTVLKELLSSTVRLRAEGTSTRPL